MELGFSKNKYLYVSGNVKFWTPRSE